MAISIVVGAGAWALLDLALDGEPWDHGVYWWLAYPVMLFVAGLLGFASHRAPWLWGFVIVLSQCVWFLSNLHGQAIVLPITIAVFLVLSVPCMIAGAVGQRLGSRKGKESEAV